MILIEEVSGGVNMSKVAAVTEPSRDSIWEISLSQVVNMTR